MKRNSAVTLICALLTFGSAEDVSSSSQVENVAKCSPLNAVSTESFCSNSRKSENCDFPVPAQTRAEISCLDGYKEDKNSVTPRSSIVQCNENGKWEPDPIKCTPICGITIPYQLPLILNGSPPPISEFLWHASLYKERTSPSGTSKEFRCGATIIHSSLLLTSATCVYNEGTKTALDPRELFVMTGNVFRDYDSPMHNPKFVTKAEVKNVYVHCGYRGIDGAYESDIALVELEQPFKFSRVLLPACLDFDNYSEQILEPGALWRVATFGSTDVGSNDGILQTLSVPYVSNSQCKSSLSSPLNADFITQDKFCTGRTNRSNLCHGSSGDGLVFQKDDVWYVLGIVSVAVDVDHHVGDKKCEEYSHSAHTNVSNYTKWIQKAILEIEQSQSFSGCD